MNVPGTWALVLLGLAAYRIYRLIGEDTVLDVPRGWLLGLPRAWKEGQAVPASYREWLANFVTCAWCLGFWVALAWWAAWMQWPLGTLVIATPFAISAFVGLIAHFTTEDTD
jgi:hypothetical protein